MHVDGGGVLCRAIIPHPLLYIVEDGPLLPACAAASIRCRPEHCLDKCPSELLDLVARNLLTGKDLVSFACVCRTTRSAASALPRVFCSPVASTELMRAVGCRSGALFAKVHSPPI